MKSPARPDLVARSGLSAQAVVPIVLSTVLAIGISAAVVHQMLRPPPRGKAGPAREAIAFAGPIPLASEFLTSYHSAGREAILPGSANQEAMTGESFDRWADLAPLAGGTLLTLPEGAASPLLKRLRLDQGKGELRLASLGPGAWMEGQAEAGDKGFPLDTRFPEPTLSVIQVLRFRPEPGGNLSALSLTNSQSGRRWIGLRASWDGSFEALLGPEGRSFKVSEAGPAGRFFIVGLTWEAKKLKGKAVLTVRPEGGGQRKSAEISYVPPAALEPLDQVRVGEKADSSSTTKSTGTLEVLDTLVFNRNLRPEHLRLVEDWLYRRYFGGVPLEANGSVP